MDTSPNFSLPYIMPGQAQKHLTHNEAIRMLDALVQLTIIDRNSSQPPTQIQEGDSYLVASNAQASWTGKENYIACYQDNSWAFMQPKPGWMMWVVDEESAFVFSGTDWIPIAPEQVPLATTSIFGVNTQGDNVNKLAVKSDAILFSHDDVTPGTGDIRMVVNKSNSSATGSVVFQTGFSGRTEIGSTGDDDFRVKVSPDGSNWYDVLVANKNTGSVTLPNTVPTGGQLNMLQDSGRFAGSPDTYGVTIGSFVAPNYVSPYNGAVFSAGPKFVHNNGSYGGTGSVLDPIIDAFISRIKPSTERRYGNEFYSVKVTAGALTGPSLLVNGTTHELAIANLSVLLPEYLSVNYSIYVESGSIGIGRSGDLYIDGVYSASSAEHIQASDGWKQVTQLLSRSANYNAGYEGNLFRIYATTGSVFHLIAPFITTGHITTKPNKFYGITPGMQAWA